jgi:hypothetical protein
MMKTRLRVTENGEEILQFCSICDSGELGFGDCSCVLGVFCVLDRNRTERENVNLFMMIWH